MKHDVILVDRDDNEIGHIRRDQVSSEDYYRVAALWLTDQYGNILIAQRKLDKLNDPGKWGPAAAGTVEVGETYESNIYKEAEEELGLTGLDFSKGPHQTIENIRKFHCQWFTGVADHDYSFSPQPDEVEKVSWIEPAVLKLELATNPAKYLNSMLESSKLFGP